MRKNQKAAGILRWAVIALLIFFSLAPILFVISTAFKPTNEIYSLSLIPKAPTLSNYRNVFRNDSMLRYFLNTAIVSAFTTVLSMVVATLGAYGFSRYKFPGAGGVIGFIMFTRVLPRVTIIIPFYVTLSKLRLLNTYPGLILVYLMVVMPVTIWMLKGFFDGIPHEIEEAAAIDGCSPLRMLFRVVLPICLPALAAVGMYAFILSWNEFLFALIMTGDKATRPISVGLAFYIDETGVHWGELMAASALMSVPAVIVFSLSQNMLVKGLSAGAVKG